MNTGKGDIDFRLALRTQAFERSLKRIEKNTQKGFGQVKKIVRDASLAADRATGKSTRNMRKHWRKTRQSVDEYRAELSKVIGATATLLGANRIVRYADDWKQAANRLKGAGIALEDVGGMQDHVLRIANKTNQAFTSTADLLANITIASRKLGTSQAENLELAENLQKAFTLSGTGQNAISGALTQISQGLGSGQFQSEELNSIFDASPLLTDALLEEFKVDNVKALKDLAAEGEITADRVAKAFLGMSAQLDRAMQNFEPTVGQAFTRLTNNATAFFGKLDEGLGVTDGLSTIILALADNLDEVAKIAGVAGGALAGMAAASVIRNIMSMATALRSMAAAGSLVQVAMLGLNPVTAVLTAIGAAIAGIIIYKDDLITLFDAGSEAAQRATQAQIAYEQSLKGVDQAIEQAITISSDLRSEIDKANGKTNQRIDRLRAERQELIANTRAELQRKAAMAENAAITANQRVLDAQKVIDNVQGMGGNADNLVAAQKASSQEWQTQIALSQKYYQQLERFEKDIDKPVKLAPKAAPASSGSVASMGRRRTRSGSGKPSVTATDTIDTIIAAQQAGEGLAQAKTDYLDPYLQSLQQVQTAEEDWLVGASEKFGSAIQGAQSFEEALKNIATTLAEELIPELVKMAAGLDNMFANGGQSDKPSLLGSLIKFGGALIGEFGGSDFTAQAGATDGNLATLGGNSGLTAGFAGSSTPFATLGSGGFGGFRAGGGPVQSGKAYMVGERGPEIVIPNFDGSVINNAASTALMGAAHNAPRTSASGSGSGSQSVSFHISVDARGAVAGVPDMIEQRLQTFSRRELAPMMRNIQQRGG